MADRVDSRTWMHRIIFALLAFTLIVIDLVPLDMRPAAWAAPDVLLVVTLVWVARNPAFVPVLTVAILFLLADLLFMRPPGLWAALVVILSEVIRRQHRDFRTMSLFVEWGTIAAGIVAITLANRLALALVMLPQPPLGLSLIELVFTIMVYPLVVLVAHFIFGVSRVTPGDVGRKGQLL